MRRTLFMSLLAVFAFSHAGDVVSNVTLTQHPETKFVTVSYALAQDAVVTFDIEADGVPVARRFLSDVFGDVNCRVSATTGDARRSFQWNPTTAWHPTNRIASLKAVVKAWPNASPPDYLVHDLRTMRTSYYETTDEFPQGSVTNSLYKVFALVMRKIPAAGVTWWMGNGMNQTIPAADAYRKIYFDHDYYFSVYEITEGLARWMQGQRVGDDVAYQRPALALGVTDMNANVLPAFNGNTGLTLRLPTSAEWEYACRAGTDGARFCTDAELYDYARLPANHDVNAKGEAIASVVGTRKPNPWGLYDMLGNVNERVSDWWGPLQPNIETPETNPQGPATGTSWVFRGGSYMDSESIAICGFSGGYAGTSASLGFRLVLDVAAAP